MTVTPAGVCPVCRSAVPEGAFCAYCGCDKSKPAAGWRTLLRPRVFAVSSGEPLPIPMVTSSLFPHLPESMRWPFRHGLFLVFSALLGFSMLKWLAPLVTVVCLGVPLLFALYVWQSGVFKDVSRRVLLAAVAVAAVISAAWWVWTGALVARAYGIPTAAGSQLQRELALGLVVTIAGLALMLSPILVVKLFHRQVRESLDGFVIGAACALSYSAAGTIAWLAPQFTAGLVDKYVPSRLFEEAYLYGFVDPISAAAVGGLLGLLLWFRPGPAAGAGRAKHPRAARATLAGLTVVATGLYVGIYLVDAAETTRFTEIAVNTVLGALSLVTLRAGIQVTLLQEDADPGTGRPVLCEDCERTVPDRPFCPGCGAAARATSRTARARRLTPETGSR